MIKWTHIMIHHSLTEDGSTVSWSAIRRYHMAAPEYRFFDIGYHFGVERVGTDYEALVGRPLDTEGAHCREGEMNRKAIGICLVGNFDLYPPSTMIMRVLRDRLLLPLMRIYSILPQNIVFHRDFARYKTCPGSQFSKDYMLAYTPGGIT